MVSLSNHEVRASLHLQRARGTGRITVKLRDGQAAIDTLYQEGCAKIRLPHTHDDSLQAVMINTAGGLCGGDDLRWQADAAAGTRVVLTTPACERVYRSTGSAARVANRLAVGRRARLHWLPQETILFENSRLDRTLEVDLAEDATLVALETVLLGREARGETARRATLADNWRVRRNGRLLHAEVTRLTGSVLERDGAALLGGANALATLLYVGADSGRLLEPVRALLNGRSAASVIGERLVVRALAGSGQELRRHIIPALQLLCGQTPLPRLWHL